MRQTVMFLTIFILIALLGGCGVDGNATINPTGTPTMPVKVTPQLPLPFVLQSSVVAEGGVLPKDYTCDGTSDTLPLSWSGAPDRTSEFAIIMHHIPEQGDSHWYWTLYNIPSTVTSLPRNVSGIGTLGTNSVNHKSEYAPPCSKGPGMKVYTYTIYALSGPPKLAMPHTQVTRDSLLAAIKDITLASATLNVRYAR